jgi:O-acetyl-ADP-ribose deacetylase (regulator of RNase III)
MFPLSVSGEGGTIKEDSMIEHVSGNLLEADVEALVNTVNTVGIMGKGIALQFRQAFPENYEAYRKACELGEVEPGQMFVFHTGELHNPRFIINFPTKRHWKGKSKMADIESGLAALVKVIRKERIRSIALPPLGCGNGGLNWDDVLPHIKEAFAALPETRLLVYAPAGAPAAEQMPVATKTPNMTAGRAALIGLLADYAVPGYRLTLLEVQKLAYFLQTAGEPLRLKFVKERYGPYAETLHHVLQRLDGHFIRGYGDRSRDASIRLLPEARGKADEFLQEHPDTRHRLERVAGLIDGFETPYGMELLATVHWVAQESSAARTDVTMAVQGVHSWSDHKKRTFRPEHIQVAWQRLHEQKWL